ncbi:MAG TPA: hypothetical protein VF255_10385 [Solirubrobacterales bacterium]
MKLASGLAVLSLGLMPAAGMAQGVDYSPDPPKTPKGPKTEPQGKAYGYHCRGESKEHEEGQKGTDFALCVKAMAQAAKNENLHPKKACKGLSKKHVKGEKGTPFSRCVKDVNKMRKEEREKEAETAV